MTKLCNLLVTFLLYLLLFGLFLNFYFIQQFREYLESKTTFSSSIELRDHVEVPNLILCPFPQPIKYDNFAKYGVTTSFWNAVADKAPDYNLTMVEMYNEFTYILNRDYVFRYFNGKSLVDLNEGKNDISGFYLDLKPIFTMSGTCHLILTNATTKQLDSTTYIKLETKTNITSFSVYFTDEYNWQEIGNFSH